MPLRSKLFSTNGALQAAAVQDAAHITLGMSGAHVKKIQIALNILDAAMLSEDGIYGKNTANAVLNYKSKRNIINRSYQSSADNIVGRMTIQKLDEELLQEEINSRKKPVITRMVKKLKRPIDQWISRCRLAIRGVICRTFRVVQDGAAQDRCGAGREPWIGRGCWPM